MTESWWQRWNRECGTSLTRFTATRISRRAASVSRGTFRRLNNYEKAVPLPWPPKKRKRKSVTAAVSPASVTLLDRSSPS